MSPPLRLAVVGHTNAGKTSLLRTLLRDRAFGEVSIRPATTRHVEARFVRLSGGLVLELADTPGLEDSMGLLDALHAAIPSPRATGAERIAVFLAGPLAGGVFAQEAKALRQLLASDLVLYVVDAREPILGKYRDECSIVASAGKPCLAVLNFIASARADADGWREALQTAGIHNVTGFDTVVFDADDERRLWQQVGLLLPAAEAHCARLVAERAEESARQRTQAARLVAEALIDCAALRSPLDAAGASALAARVRAREQALDRDLLALFRFGDEDVERHELPLAGTPWSLDPFDVEVLRALGLALGGSAAKGAAAGAAVDALTAFHSLGTATLVGGAVGAVVDAVARLGRHARARWRGLRYERLDASSAVLIARRAVLLVRDLLRRGHAATSPLATRTRLARPLPDETRLRRCLARAARHHEWSTLGEDAALGDAARGRTRDRLQQLLQRAIEDAPPAGGTVAG